MGLLRKAPPHPGRLLPLMGMQDDTLLTTQGCYFRGFEIIGIDSEYVEAGALTGVADLLYDAAKRDLPTDLFLQFVVSGDSDYADVWQSLQKAPQPDSPLLAYHREQRIEFLAASNPRRHRIFLMVGSARGLTRTELKKRDEVTHNRKLAEAKRLAEQVAAAFEVDIEAARLALLPLSGESMLSVIHAALNEGEPYEGGAYPSRMTLREQMLSCEMSYGMDHVRIGTRYTQVLTLKELPDETRFTDMELFLGFGFDLRLSVNFTIPKQDANHTKMRLVRNVSKSYAEGINPHAVDAQDEARADAFKNLDSEMVQTGQISVHCGMQVAIAAESMQEVRRRAAIFKARTKRKGFVFFEETGVHDREIFNTLPGMAVRFNRWRKVLSGNSVDLMPLFGACGGDRAPVFLLKTDREELFSYNPAEWLRSNWNMMVLGESGTGKSVLVNKIILNAMLTNVSRGDVTIVDYAGEDLCSYLGLVKLFGGVFIPLLSKGGKSINPFPPRSQALTADGKIEATVFDRLMVFLNLLVGNTGEDQAHQLNRVDLGDALRLLYARHEAATPPLLQDYGAALQSLKTPRSDNLSLILGAFLKEEHARLFNSQTTLDVDSPFVVIDMYGIKDLPEKLKGALSYIVCQHVRNAAFKSSAAIKYVVLDEVAQLLHAPGMKPMVEELYMTARKHNTSVLTVTQEYLTYCKSAVNETISGQSTTQMFLSHQHSAAAAKRIVTDFKFNAREEHLFDQLRTKKGQYSEILMRTKVADGVRGDLKSICSKLRLELSPFDYQLTTSDPTDRAAIRALAEQHKDWSLLDVLQARAQGARHVA